jgi:IS1 family transposase
VHIERAGEGEMERIWNVVGKKGHRSWLWHAINNHTEAVLASVFG